MQFQKNPYFPTEEIGFSWLGVEGGGGRGERVSKTYKVKKYQAELEFPEGWGVDLGKTPFHGEVWILNVLSLLLII